MDIYITSCLEFLRTNKDLLSLLLAPVIIPCLKFIWLNIKRFIYLPRQLRNSDSERILEFFSKEKFDKLKLEHKVIQDILIQKISVFKGYSIEKVERLLNANIGNNNSFLFYIITTFFQALIITLSRILLICFLVSVFSFKSS